MATTTLDASDPRILASHLAAFGLGSIAEQHFGPDRVRVWWTPQMRTRPCIEVSDADEEALAVAVRSHAAAAQQWLDLTFPDHTGKPRALMSPRRGMPEHAEQVRELHHRREEVIDGLAAQARTLDQRLIGGLGMPSTWHFDTQGKPQPDWAASRLDMQPRNQGAELVGSKLKGFASWIAEADTASLAASIAGERMQDSLGKDFTGTGLAPRGPFDTVLAWCALWGLSCVPVGHRATWHGWRSRSATTGFLEGARVDACAVIMPGRPMRMPAIRALQRSARTTQALGSDAQARAAGAWLAEMGVPMVARFSVTNRGSGNASQRIADLGSFHPTATDETV